MEFILRDNYIYIVNNAGLVNHNIEATVNTEFVEDVANKKIEYSVNGEAFKPVKESKVLITKEELKKPYIDLVFRAVGKDAVELFKVERMPLTYAVIFGEAIEKAYPEKIKQLENKLDRFIDTAQDILNYVQELEKKGRLL